jgi:hypothetical protein
MSPVSMRTHMSLTERQVIAAANRSSWPRIQFVR